MYHTVVSCPLAHMAISSGEVYSWNKTSAYVYTTYVQKDKFWYQIPCMCKNAYSVLQIYLQLTMHLTVTLLVT